MCRDWLIALVCFVVGSHGDITGTNPPAGSCLCVDGATVNVRNGPCGGVIGQSNTGECFSYSNAKQTCDLSGTIYEFFETNFYGDSGWMAGDYLIVGLDTACESLPAPDPEHRSLFVSTAWNIDWPTSSSDSSSAQQGQMITYLDRMQTMNMNAMMLQVRPAADAFYDSPIEPWSRFLTGTQGQAPSPYYDPLQFTIDEAHSRGMEVHVWLNPYRANLASNTNGLAANHVCLTLSQYCYPYGNLMWLDPGAQSVIDHLVSVVSDITGRYDVDGVHFDDYFYPYPNSGEFPDSATYQDYLNGGGQMAKDDWRRDNVNRMVEQVYNTIRAVPGNNIKFSISPFGIYRPGHATGMPPPIAGLDPYTAQFADTKLWLQSGWVDFYSPQLYWEITPPAQSYPVLLDWWLNANPLNRHIYPANAVYKVPDNGWPVSEIVNQIAVTRDDNRRNQFSLGNIMFSAKYFRDNTAGIYDIFRSDVYPTPANIPPMPWLGLATPVKPDVKVSGKTISLESSDDEMAHTWSVYKKDGLRWTMLKKLPKSTPSFEAAETGTYAVRVANRANELSEHAIAIVISTNGKA